MDRRGFFYKRFRDHFPYDLTPDQDRLFSEIAGFLVGDDHDILVVNGYAGTGKTTALAAVIEAMDDLRPVKTMKIETVKIVDTTFFNRSSPTPCPVFIIFVFFQIAISTCRFLVVFSFETSFSHSFVCVATWL